MSKPNSLREAQASLSNLQAVLALYQIGRPTESPTVPLAIVCDAEVLNALKFIFDFANDAEDVLKGVVACVDNTDLTFTCHGVLNRSVAETIDKARLLAGQSDTFDALKASLAATKPKITVRSWSGVVNGSLKWLELQCWVKGIVCERVGREIELEYKGTTGVYSSVAQAIHGFYSEAPFCDLVQRSDRALI